MDEFTMLLKAMLDIVWMLIKIGIGLIIAGFIWYTFLCVVAGIRGRKEEKRDE